MFSSSTVDPSSRRFHCDETEFHADSSTAKKLSEHVEAFTESPVHKSYMDEHEISLDINVSHRKMAKDKTLDPSLETHLVKTNTEESFIHTTPQRLSRDRRDIFMDVAPGKGISDELDNEMSSTKIEKDMMGSLKDITSRNIYKERCNLPLDMRKILRTDLEASTDRQRKISRDMMGTSMDITSKMISRDDAELLLESRRTTRNPMEMPQDTGSRKHALNTGESHLDSPVRAFVKEKIVEMARIPQRKISRDEMEYYTDTASMNMLPREMLDEHMDTLTSADLQELGLRPSTSRGKLRNEGDVSVSSLRKRVPRMPRDNTYSSAVTSTGNMCRDRVDVPVEIPEQPILKEEVGTSEYSSLPWHTGQPDLMLTSQPPWKSSSDLHNVGPLCQLVYDGILEKSCRPMVSVPTSLSASTPVLPQTRLQAEVEPPVPPSKAVFPSHALPPEGGDDKNKDRDKSKKTLKLKNLFKKKNESPEKLQSGLQKL